MPARTQQEICHAIVELVTEVEHTQPLPFCQTKKIKKLSLLINIALFPASDTVPGKRAFLIKLSKKILPLSEKVELVCLDDDYIEELEPIRT